MEYLFPSGKLWPSLQILDKEEKSFQEQTLYLIFMDASVTRKKRFIMLKLGSGEIVQIRDPCYKTFYNIEATLK